MQGFELSRLHSVFDRSRHYDSLMVCETMHPETVNGGLNLCWGEHFAFSIVFNLAGTMPG